MANKQITAGLQKSENLFQTMRNAITDSSLGAVLGAENFNDFKTGLDGVAGIESAGLSSQLGNLIGAEGFEAFRASMNRDNQASIGEAQYRDAVQTLSQVNGMEGFSMQNFAGSQQDIKATNMALNAKAHRQTEAAEALYATVTVKYEDEGVNLKVRAAGLGNYAYGNTAFQTASDLRPVFGLLRTGEMFKDEVLALYPVYPEDAGEDNRVFFVEDTLVAPTPANYIEGDGFGRSGHLTQMLKVPSTIPNYLALCQAPGQRPWTSTDEVESNSLEVQRILASGELDGTDVSFFIDTSVMSNRSFTLTTNGQSSDDRRVSLSIKRLPGFSVQDKDGVKVGETLFADFLAAGVEPLLNLNFTGNYQRQHNELELNAGVVTIVGLRNIADGVIVTHSTATAPQKGLLASLNAYVTGVKIGSNVSNTSRGNFGYRVEVFDAEKKLAVRRRSPISVKYPVSADDVNKDSLDFAIDQMAVIINNQTSRYAFNEARDHLDYVVSINGSPVVGNQQGSNVLPGQHFVTATAMLREITLKDVVSSQNNKDVFDNVTGAICNEIGDIIAALNTRSGLASICEYSTITRPNWTVVAHTNIARFVMRKGEIRAFGEEVKVNVVETNFDSEIGNIIIVPENTSNSDNINPLGGIGVCVSKENVVVQGNVSRDQQEYGVLMTMPCFQHHSLNVIIGQLVVTDAAEFLDEGIISQLAKQRVVLEP